MKLLCSTKRYAGFSRVNFVHVALFGSSGILKWRNKHIRFAIGKGEVPRLKMKEVILRGKKQQNTSPLGFAPSLYASTSYRVFRLISCIQNSTLSGWVVVGTLWESIWPGFRTMPQPKAVIAFTWRQKVCFRLLTPFSESMSPKRIQNIVNDHDQFKGWWHKTSLLN